MQQAIYLNKHYKVLSKTDTHAKLLSLTDEIIEVLSEKVTFFKKLVKGVKKRKRINAKTIQRRKSIPQHLQSFDRSIAEKIAEFRLLNLKTN